MAIRISGNLIQLPIAEFAFNASTTSGTVTLPIDAVTLMVRTYVPSAHNILGITGGEEGRIVILVNMSRGFDLDCIAESGSATAANRFREACKIQEDGARAFIYVGGIARWVPLL